MPFLTMLPTLLQVLLGAMSVAEKIKAPGATKKAIVLETVKAVAPAIALLPDSTQQNIKDEAPKVAQVVGIAADLVDSLHAVAKKNDLYPELEQTFGAASDVLAGVREAAVIVGD